VSPRRVTLARVEAADAVLSEARLSRDRCHCHARVTHAARVIQWPDTESCRSQSLLLCNDRFLKYLCAGVPTGALNETKGAGADVDASR